MYTYDSFVTNGSFTLLRPIFISLIIISLFLSFLIIFPKTKQKLINGFTVISLSLVFTIVSVQVIYYDSIIVDEIGLGGDGVSTIMCLAIIALSLLNPIIYFGINNRKEKISTKCQAPSK
ncbi:hypothetical protein V7150_02545 [Neobacillus drentensis]|uniref:hypothetical protein n=1 Tax=Neobacillus drentensis TaxID=220684 RepID=UPI0030000CE4